MIVVDASALVAVIRNEPERYAFSRAIAAATPVLVSAVALHGASLVLAGSRRGDDAWEDLDDLIRGAVIEVVPFDTVLAHLARQAFLRFGKGRHPAALNLGDCASYALAKQRGAPLLYKGRDFSRTDIIPALPA